MVAVRLKNQMCCFFSDDFSADKTLISVTFDVPDFTTETDVYDYFGKCIYSGREHLNGVFKDTVYFGRNASAFHECLRGYLLDIGLLGRNELLVVTITNKSNITLNEFWVVLLTLLVQTFSSSHAGIDYGKLFKLNIAKEMWLELMNEFVFLLSERMHE